MTKYEVEYMNWSNPQPPGNYHTG